MQGTFRLEIFDSAAQEDPLYVLTSATPFSGISVGDILLPQAWDANATLTDRVEVLSVEHNFFTADGGFFQATILSTTRVASTGQ